MSTASNMNAAPQTIDQFVGAQQIVAKVKVALEATWNAGNGCIFPDTLMLGPGGLGKTELARIVARECALPITEVIGTSLRNVAALNAAVLQAEGGCFFLDEMHAVSPDVIVALLKVLQERTIFLEPQRGGRLKPLQLAPFCFIGATTDEWAIPSTITDRTRLILRFDYYGVEDMALLVSRRARSAGVVLEEGVAEMIAQRSKGTPRLGIRLLDSCVRTMQAEAAGTVSAKTFERTCELEQIDALGLDAVEQKYLRLLAQSQGTLRLNVIASSLGLPRATVERSIEPFLIRANLIQKDESGRTLTDRGWQQIGGDPLAFTKSNPNDGGGRARSA